jgi:membrane fusion protein (multidrug efflux system)
MRGKGVVGTVVGIGVLLAAAGGAWYVIQKEAPQTGAEAAAYEPMESAQIIEAREIDWQPMADMVGTVIAIRSVAVRNELAGVVREVGYQSGEIVEEGQILLRQDETSDQADLEAVRASVRVAEASVAQARSEIELAKTELERLIGVPSGAIAAVEIDRARNTLETAKADLGRWVAEVDQANARVAQMEARIAKLTIRAPFRARAGLRTVHEGQYLGGGCRCRDAPGGRRQDLPRLRDPAGICGTHRARHDRHGQRRTARPRTGPDRGCRIRGHREQLQTRNLRVRAIVNNPGGLLIARACLCRLRCRSTRPSGLWRHPHDGRPACGIRRTQVFVIAPDEAGTVRAHQRYVKLGQTDDRRGRDRSRGPEARREDRRGRSFKLRDGVAVKVAPAGQTGPAGAGWRTSRASPRPPTQAIEVTAKPEKTGSSHPAPSSARSGLCGHSPTSSSRSRSWPS